MEGLQPKSSRRCPQCAAYVSLEATDCWLCHAKLPPPAAAVMASLVPEADNAKRPLQYGISDATW